MNSYQRTCRKRNALRDSGGLPFLPTFTDLRTGNADPKVDSPLDLRHRPLQLDGHQREAFSRR
jgi:hypothetical protein